LVRSRRAGFLIVSLVLPASTWAAPPTLTGTTPLWVTRGKTMEIIVRGSALAENPRLVALFAFRLEGSAGGGPGAAEWRVRLTVDARAAVGG